MKDKKIAVFTNLDAIAWEITTGAVVDYAEVIEFILAIDERFADSVFTDALKEAVNQL